MRFGLVVAVLACHPRDESGPKTTSDTVATGEVRQLPEGAVEDAGFVRITAVTGLSGPESVRYDPAEDVYFISNFNGVLTSKDDNGFISRVRADGSMDSLRFIAGGRNGVTLNAPTGIAIVGDTLWVADVQTARAFDKHTGAPLVAVTFAGLGARMLNDVAVGPHGDIYITDTGIRLAANGAIQHPGPDRVYRIGPRLKPIVALQSEALAGPNGIAWDSAGNRFLLLSFTGKGILSWRPGQETARVIATGPGQCDGVEALGDGRALVTCWADSSLDVIEGDSLRRVMRDLPQPADLGVDIKRHRVAIPVSARNSVEIWSIPKRRT